MEGVFIPDCSDYPSLPIYETVAVPIGSHITDISTTVAATVVSSPMNTSTTIDSIDTDTIDSIDTDKIDSIGTDTIDSVGTDKIDLTGTDMHHSYPNKRPRRAAALVAVQRVKDVLKWERCKESSSMFMHASAQINAEFDNVLTGGKIYQERPVVVAGTTGMVGVETAGTGVVDTTAMCMDTSIAPSVDSDDEKNAALNSDADGQDDSDDDDSDDDVGSLASFVVDDDCMTPVGASPVRTESSCGSSSSASDRDSCSDFDSEQNDSDFDDTMICNDDSDGEDEDIEVETVGVDTDNNELVDTTEVVDEGKNELVDTAEVVDEGKNELVDTTEVVGEGKDELGTVDVDSA